MKPVNKTIWIIFFALAMGFLESAVVIYIRALYYPEGFVFPLKEMAQNLAITELLREVATLVMLVAIGMLAARERLHRFAWFLIVFGIWDIAYYLFLKLLIGWPGSLLTDDILFLLPTMWTGPVAAPLINSITMILLAYVILSGKSPKMILSLTRLEWLLLLAGSFVVLFTYMKDFACFAFDYKQTMSPGVLSLEKLLIVLPSKFIPHSFDWLLFSAGVILHLSAVLLICKRSISVKQR
jgi:hypothetical protein